MDRLINIRSFGIRPACRVESLERRSLLSALPPADFSDRHNAQPAIEASLIAVGDTDAVATPVEATAVAGRPLAPASRADQPAVDGEPSVTFKGRRAIRHGQGYSFKLIFQSSQPIDPTTLEPAHVFLAEAPSVIRKTTARKTQMSRDGRRVTVTYFADFLGLTHAYSGHYNVTQGGATVGGVDVLSRYPYSVYHDGGAHQVGISYTFYGNAGDWLAGFQPTG